MENLLPTQRENAKAHCEEYSELLELDPIHSTYGKRFKMNATQNLSFVLLEEGEDAEVDLARKFQYMFGGRFTVEECDEADCLHPCYGADHERYCNQCFLTFWDKVEEGLPFEFVGHEQELCGGCSVPSVPAEEPTPIMSFEEFMEEVQKVAAEAEQDGE